MNESNVTIRDYKYKLINNKFLLGIELVATGENFIKDSYFKVKFFKDGNIIKEDNSFVVDYIAGNGVLYLAKEYDIDFSFDNIEVEFIKGVFEYQEIYYGQIEWSFDSIDENRKVTYKIINHSQDVIPYARLNLNFYNKGSLLCGTNIDIQNLLSERTYYFEYIIPNEIDYTEAYPFLSLPKTDRLLFNEFYNKIKSLETNIKLENDKLQTPQEIVEFRDETEDYNNKIKGLNVEIENLKYHINNDKKHKDKYIKAFPKAFIKLFKVIYSVAILWVVIFIGYFIVVRKPAEEKPSLYILFVSIGIVYVICLFIEMSVISDRRNTTKKIIKGNEANIKGKEREIGRLTTERNTYINNIPKIKENIELEKAKVIEFNKSVTENNNIVNQNLEKYNKELTDLKTKYTEYNIDSYDEEDKEVLDMAINNGLKTYKEVFEFYTKEMDRRMQELKERLEQEKEEKRHQQQLNAMQKLENTLKKTKQDMQDAIRQNRIDSMNDMQSMLDNYAYISERQAQAQISAINSLNEKMKDQNIEVKRMYNQMRYY